MHAWLIPALAALGAYSAAEATWLFSMRPFYSRQFAGFARDGRLALRSPAAAALTYVILVLAVALLVAEPAYSEAAIARRGDRFATVRRATTRGAMLGGAIYGVYNLTNKATLPGYTWTMVVADTVWGAASIGAVSCVFAWLLVRRM